MDAGTQIRSSEHFLRWAAASFIALLSGCSGSPSSNPAAAAPGAVQQPPPTVAASSRWSDPATWGGSLPGDGAVVVIPAGKSIVLDTRTAALAGLQIDGELQLDERDVALTAGWVRIRGLLRAGTEAAPHRSTAAITLTGADRAADINGFGSKFMVVEPGGRLELHGVRGQGRTHTRLAANAGTGATEIELAEAMDWRPGDEIAIAPSGYDPRHAEKLRVTAVQGTRVSFQPALRHAHWGTVQRYDGRDVDQRAAVGLLTRNLLIRGDAASAELQFGGHVMVHAGGQARVSGVEFFRMGQMGLPGRYPLHWHLVDRNAPSGTGGQGQFARGNSFHDSFQRAIVLHGTSNVTVERNVAYHVFNHAFVAAEDGDEEGNVFRENLGMLVRPPARTAFALPIRPNSADDIQTIQLEATPAVFWARNVNNSWIGNVAAGAVDGHGFLFENLYRYDAAAANAGTFAAFRVQKPPRAIVFEDNVAHSNCTLDPSETSDFWQMPLGKPGVLTYDFNTTAHGLTLIGMTRGLPGGAGSLELQFRRLTSYKNCTSGAWVETHHEHLINSVFADNVHGIQGANLLRATDVLIVGQTANMIGGRLAPGSGLVFDDYGNVDLFSVTIRDTPVGLKFTDDFKMDGRTASMRLINVAMPFDASEVLSRGEGYMTDTDGSLLGRGPGAKLSVLPLGAGSEFDVQAKVYLTPR